MPPTIRKTQLMGWLKNAPTRVWFQCVVSGCSAERVLSLADTRLPQENLLVLLFLFGVLLGVEIVHLDKLNLVGTGKWRINAFTIHKFTGLGHNRHAFLTEEKVNQRFACIGVGRFTA